MLKIKLVRKGKRNLPSFRVEVTAGKKTVESIGSYYPHSTRSHFIVSKEKLEQWLKAGAQITPAVSSLLKGKYEFKKYVPKKSGADSQELAVGKQEPGVAAPVTGGPKPAAEETPPSAPGVQEPEHPEASVSKIDSPANPKGLTKSCRKQLLEIKKPNLLLRRKKKTMLEDLLEYIVKEIVSEPKKVKISETAEADGTVHLTLSVAEEDMGTVIGKQGKTIVAIRSLLKTAAAKAGQHVFLELEEKDPKRTAA